jgi:hypothetical protein
MTIATHPQVSAGATTNGHEPADVLVVFGITGDLAKVMTFGSLYRLEQRGLIDCPIVGVAVDDWTVDDLRRRARESIGERRSTRRSSAASPSGSPTSRATSATPAPFGASRRRSTASAARSSTSRSRPSCSARWSAGSRRPA